MKLNAMAKRVGKSAPYVLVLQKKFGLPACKDYPEGYAVLVDYELDSQRRGTKASNHWLWENIENLKKLPVGSYMDKTCTRVYPTRPKSNRY